jgi:hypothetical protein
MFAMSTRARRADHISRFVPALAATLLIACDRAPELAEPRAEQREARSSLPLQRRATTQLGGGLSVDLEPIEIFSHASLDFLRREPPQGVRRVWTPPSPVAEMAAPLVGGRLVQGGDERLRAALEALPPERRALGVRGLTADALRYDNDANRICNAPLVDFEIREGGQTFEARYEGSSLFWHGEPAPDLYALSSTCTDALLATGGALDDAVNNGCAPADAAAHFQRGSRCRTCLEADGDHARCVAEGQCRVEMARSVETTIDGRRAWADVVRAPTLACAPNYMTETVYLTRDLGDDNVPPGPFDHKVIEHLCFEFWHEDSGRTRLHCAERPPEYMGIIHFAIADLLIARVKWIRRPGEDSTPYFHRVATPRSMEIDGMTFVGSPLYPGKLAEVSETPGWGYEPYKDRPDGKSLARDYLAVIALKTATTIDGVPINIYNRNLCDDADWKGPDAMGRYFCPTADRGPGGPPDVDRWAYDWTVQTHRIDPLDIEIFPLVTLGSTGRFDPSIPGGHVPHILGTESLANPNWDNCAWPEMFTPDEIANQDGAGFDPLTYTAQTYRFGKDPDLDLRAVLATNWRRGFCFEPIPGL